MAVVLRSEGRVGSTPSRHLAARAKLVCLDAAMLKAGPSLLRSPLSWAQRHPLQWCRAFPSGLACPALLRGRSRWPQSAGNRGQRKVAAPCLLQLEATLYGGR